MSIAALWPTDCVESAVAHETHRKGWQSRPRGPLSVRMAHDVHHNGRGRKRQSRRMISPLSVPIAHVAHEGQRKGWGMRDDRCPKHWAMKAMRGQRTNASFRAAKWVRGEASNSTRFDRTGAEAVQCEVDKERKCEEQLFEKKADRETPNNKENTELKTKTTFQKNEGTAFLDNSRTEKTKEISRNERNN